MKLNRFVSGLIVIEICAILYISTSILLTKIQNRDAPPNINPLTSEIIHLSPNERLQNYYTLPSGTTKEERVAWLSQPVSYSFNKDRLHDRYDYATDKPANTFRIVTLGDSFVYGMWVNTSQNFSELLEDKLNASMPCKKNSKFEVLNLGVPGFDLIYALERYKDVGAKYNPDLIIWFMRDENIYLNADRYHDLSMLYRNELEAKSESQKSKTPLDISLEASDLAYKKIIEDFKHATIEQQQELLSFETSALFDMRKLYGGAMLITTDTTIPGRFLDLITKFIQSSENTYYAPIEITETFHPYDYHPSLKGHEDMATQLFDITKHLLLTPCTDSLK